MCLKSPYFTRARDSTPDSIPVSRFFYFDSVTKNQSMFWISHPEEKYMQNNKNVYSSMIRIIYYLIYL